MNHLVDYHSVMEKENNTINDGSVFAIHEQKDGTEIVGISFYENPGTNNASNDTKYGLKFLVSDPTIDQEILKDHKMIITNDGRFFINQEPYKNSATVDINGSLRTNNVITIGENNDDDITYFGSIRYKKYIMT